MGKRRKWITTAALVAASAVPARSAHPASPVDAARFPAIARVGPHYLSINLEMAEVAGGEFWAPYDDPQQRRYAPRPPARLDDPRLVALARGLRPALLRVSGTWANSLYLARDGEEPGPVPPGFFQRIEAPRWRALTRFARASGLPLLLSVPASQGTRDAKGDWTDEQARRLVEAARADKVRIAGIEFINEPNLAKLGRLPDGYDAARYGRDFARFRRFVRQQLPGTILLGHSTSGQGGDIAPQALFAAAGPVDAVSYHFYGALSPRCAAYGNQVSADEALSPQWLARTEKDYDDYRRLRDRYAPGKPIWLTETAQAACGGSDWAASWRDTFRFVDQLGRLARHGVALVAHNTLDAGDYALVDGRTLAPRPNYWAAFLWQRMMGQRVLDAAALGEGVYAHCQRGVAGGVAMVFVNSGAARSIRLSTAARLYRLDADDLSSSEVRLNGRVLGEADLSRAPVGIAVSRGGRIDLPPRTIAFVTLARAGHPTCRLKAASRA